MPAQAAKALFLAASMGLHAAALVAVGPAASSSDGWRRSPEPEFPIEVAPALEVDPSGPRVVQDVTRVSEFVPPATPSHPHARAVSPRTDAQAQDPSQTAHFTMTVVQQDVHEGPSASAVSRNRPTAHAEEPVSAVLPENGVSSPALLTSSLAPPYPPQARAQEVEADVVLSIVVTATGAVADASILRPAGFGFDEVALRAVQAARFAPAQRDGRRVAVRMRWTVSFRLR
jgi:TonB family protein